MTTAPFWQRWLPQRTPRAVVGVVHGGAEHGGRYPRLVEALLDRDLAVYAADLRGHGRTPGRRATVSRFGDYLDDLTAFTAVLEREHPRGSRFLVGYSLGGLVTATYAARGRVPLSGIVLAGPALGPAGGVSRLRLNAARALSVIAPRLPIMRMDAARMTQDPEVARRYRDDPLVHHKRIDARMLAEVAVAMREVFRDANAIRVPVLVVHGADDRMADPDASRRLIGRCSSQDKALNVYAATHHDVFNEPAGERAAAEVAAWITARSRTEET